MHSHLSFRVKAKPILLASALALFSASVIAAEIWQTLPPTKIGAAITDQIDSHPDLTYARYGERELQLDLFRPRNADKPLPAIVCIHGGGWQSGNRLNHGHLAKALAARGFVAVSISYRLSGEATFPAQIHDAKAAVRWLRANAKQWGIDPDAIGATGLSAGGHLTALLATSGGVAELEGDGGNAKFSSAIQAAAPMGAQSDFMSERNREVSRTADIWQKFLGGSQEDVPGVYRLASPRSHLDAKDPPTMFISGEFDDASTHADEFRRDCMALGISSELLVIPGAPHPFLTKQAFFDIAIDRLDAFFSLHLKRKGIPAIPIGVNTPAKENKFSANVQIPQLAFAAQELDAALKEAGREDLQVTLIVNPDALSPEAFQIRTDGPDKVEVIGSDATGAMYGGIEVAEHLKLGLPITDVKRTPFVEKRGIKFNIPLDARSPSYDDSGDAANENVVHMWDFEGFWKPYLDDLARYRYNVLGLWTCHPYPHMVRTPGYEEAVEADVYKVRDGVLKHDSKGKFIARTFDANDGEWEDGDLDSNKDGVVDTNDNTLELVRKMTIDEKIAHWKKVFKHAGDRGIQITMFHWNVFTYGATGKHGITADQTNPATIAYLRAAVKELVLNYPSITAIGIAAGENDNEHLKGDDSTEAYIFKTYGQGVMDAKADPRWGPGREVRFIFRNHSTDIADVEEHFASKYDGPVDAEVKYCVGRLYSSRKPQEWEKRAIKKGWVKGGYKVWMNIRNDDIYLHRWGSPDYVRQFIREMPLDQSPGFMMGSDGYVWGRVFCSTVPELQGQLEIDKHWYNFRLWGELAYNNELGDDYWAAALKHRFALNDEAAKLLHDAWQTVSEVVPQLNRAVYEGTDAAISPEGCIFAQASATGFLTIPMYYYGEGPPVYRREPMLLRKNPPAGEIQCVSAPEWGRAYLDGKLDRFGGDKLTPLEVADNLDSYADAVAAALPSLQSQVGDKVELRDLLWDLESMASLGRYYADKQRCAAKYWVCRESGFADANQALHDEAIAHIKDAQRHWEDYAAILDKHYQSQLLSRTHYLDWNSILNNGMNIQAAHFGVRREVDDIINKAYPKKERPQKRSKK